MVSPISSTGITGRTVRSVYSLELRSIFEPHVESSIEPD